MEAGTLQCYTAAHSNPKVYVWRLVSAMDVEEMPDFRLLPPNKTPSFEAPGFLMVPQDVRLPVLIQVGIPAGSPDRTSAPITVAYDAARAKPLHDSIVARGELVATLPK